MFPKGLDSLIKMDLSFVTVNAQIDSLGLVYRLN